MKRINESQLAARVSSLKERMAEIEAQQQNEGIIGNAWNAVKSGAGKVAGALGLGAAGGAAAGAAMSKPAAPATGAKSDPAVMKQQQDLIAKGAKIKADGIMGPATQAAMKQFGGQAAAPAATTAPAAPAAPEAPAAPTAPPAPTGSAALNPNAPGANPATTIPTGGLENQANQAQAPAAAPAPTGSAALNPNAPGANAATTIPSGGLENQANQAQAPATAPATAAVQNNANSSVRAESIGFQNDELSRLVSLVHYR